MIKLNLSKPLIRLMYKFVDVEFSGNVAIVDDRMIEYSYALSRVLQNIKQNSKVLDVGCVARINVIPQTLCELGYSVTGIDVRNFLYKHPNFNFIQGNITTLKDMKFDIVTLVSTLEHIGIKGRYGISDNDDHADYETIYSLWDNLSYEGTLILTVPFAEVGKQFGINRIYDDKRVDRLFKGMFRITEKVYYERYDDILITSKNCTSHTSLLCLTAKKIE